MKKIILLFVFSFLLFTSCKKEPKEIAKENIEKYFLETANDPTSYEFVKMSKLDTLYKKVHYSNMVNSYQNLLSDMDDYPARIKKFKEHAKFFKSYGKKYESDVIETENFANELQVTLDDTKSQLEKFRLLLKNSKEDDIKDINTEFTCRANNKMGAKVLATYAVVLSDSLTVVSMKQE